MPHEDIGALWGGDPSLFTPTFTPLPDSAKDIEFGGTVPEEINVRWSYSINAPKHIVWQNLMVSYTESASKLVWAKGGFSNKVF